MSAVLDVMCDKYPELVVCLPDVEKAAELLKQTFHGGGKLLLCGNGGSASDSEHIVGELMKGFRSKRYLSDEARSSFLKEFPDAGDFLADHLQGALPAISLVSHSALITAYANDVSAEMIFAQQVYGYGKRGDTLLGLSTSGNSANVARAIQVAKVQGLHTIGLTGNQGGQMAELCDVTIRVPWELTPDIQERHLPIYHALCIMLEEEFFPS
ncbi:MULTISPECIES: SIS domain-containing protein [Paenibacillus]|jgi:phosphoheptose isomerase|uniref:SIS domain-containing protein n=1 Tax=Paenibacillus baimaensis TaxID=2982185 RepID=A0ABT2UIA0_9BACL|nr:MULTISPECIES: SIS domain-containing protein [unclassified Paenibacillus]MCU6794373.1 SIS domain-containing protein [Paenibacillus sp. WQ 127069]OMF12715.1 phosphoheptose isomerase [Paenibacillus sp. FSL H7-0331]